MSVAQLFAQHAAPMTGPSPYRVQFLREQVVTTPILGVVVRRIFVGV